MRYGQREGKPWIHLSTFFVPTSVITYRDDKEEWNGVEKVF